MLLTKEEFSSFFLAKEGIRVIVVAPTSTAVISVCNELERIFGTVEPQTDLNCDMEQSIRDSQRPLLIVCSAGFWDKIMKLQNKNLMVFSMNVIKTVLIKRATLDWNCSSLRSTLLSSGRFFVGHIGPGSDEIMTLITQHNGKLVSSLDQATILVTSDKCNSQGSNETIKLIRRLIKGTLQVKGKEWVDSIKKLKNDDNKVKPMEKNFHPAKPLQALTFFCPEVWSLSADDKRKRALRGFVEAKSPVHGCILCVTGANSLSNLIKASVMDLDVLPVSLDWLRDVLDSGELKDVTPYLVEIERPLYTTQPSLAQFRFALHPDLDKENKNNAQQLVERYMGSIDDTFPHVQVCPSVVKLGSQKGAFDKVHHITIHCLQSYDSQLHPHDCNDYFSHRPLMIEHNSASQVCGRKVFIAAELGEHEHSFLAEVIVGLKAKLVTADGVDKSTLVFASADADFTDDGLASLVQPRNIFSTNFFKRILASTNGVSGIRLREQGECSTGDQLLSVGRRIGSPCHAASTFKGMVSSPGQPCPPTHSQGVNSARSGGSTDSECIATRDVSYVYESSQNLCDNKFAAQSASINRIEVIDKIVEVMMPLHVRLTPYLPCTLMNGKLELDIGKILTSTGFQHGRGFAISFLNTDHSPEPGAVVVIIYKDQDETTVQAWLNTTLNHIQKCLGLLGYPLQSTYNPDSSKWTMWTTDTRQTKRMVTVSLCQGQDDVRSAGCKLLFHDVVFGIGTMNQRAIHSSLLRNKVAIRCKQHKTSNCFCQELFEKVYKWTRITADMKASGPVLFPGFCLEVHLYIDYFEVYSDIDAAHGTCYELTDFTETNIVKELGKRDTKAYNRIRSSSELLPLACTKCLDRRYELRGEQLLCVEGRICDCGSGMNAIKLLSRSRKRSNEPHQRRCDVSVKDIERMLVQAATSRGVAATRIEALQNKDALTKLHESLQYNGPVMLSGFTIGLLQQETQIVIVDPIGNYVTLCTKFPCFAATVDAGPACPTHATH